MSNKTELVIINSALRISDNKICIRETNRSGRITYRIIYRKHIAVCIVKQREHDLNAYLYVYLKGNKIDECCCLINEAGYVLEKQIEILLSVL